MREFILLPVGAIAILALLPIVALLLVVSAAVMWLGEAQGWVRAGGLNRDDG
jgi:hypothetical protein